MVFDFFYLSHYYLGLNIKKAIQYNEGWGNNPIFEQAYFKDKG